MMTTARLTLRRQPSISARPTLRAPLMPSGWPRAMAPPLAFTCSASSGSPRSRVTARAWAAKASFSSITSMSDSFRPAFSSTLRVAGAGPKPMMRGGTPAVALATTRARGVSPCRRAIASSARMMEQAPSFTPEALPAVTDPPSRRKGVGNLASASAVVSGRRCSTGPHHQ